MRKGSKVIINYKQTLLFAALVTISSGTLSHAFAHQNQKEDMFSPIREAKFTNFIERKVLPFWDENAKPGVFVNKQGLKIHFVEIKNAQAKNTLVISPGRVEGYLKYQEMAYDLVKQGYRVFIIDHQGQGLSSRLLVNTHKGHVAHFDDYSRDFNQFMTEIVRPKTAGDVHMLCHSMGSAIGLRYLQQYENNVEKVAFSSPMWGLPTGPVPAAILKPMVKSAAWFVEQVESQNPYFLGSGDYKSIPFAINTLTHSKARYDYFRKVYSEHPQLKLGGVTYSWVVSSINALDKAYEELYKIRIPTLVLQAEKDIVVDNTAQDKFCERLAERGNACKSGAPMIVKGAKHEIFIESDDIRNKGLDLIFNFFQN